jgi:hypothetical protein
MGLNFEKERQGATDKTRPKTNYKPTKGEKKIQFLRDFGR